MIGDARTLPYLESLRVVDLRGRKRVTSFWQF
jgi:hypothetical protein